jgi:hypothetical protein
VIDDEDEEVCGETRDHDVVVDYEDPEGVQWHCTYCEIEVWDPAPITEPTA